MLFAYFHEKTLVEQLLLLLLLLLCRSEIILLLLVIPSRGGGKRAYIDIVLRGILHGRLCTNFVGLVALVQRLTKTHQRDSGL